MSPRPTATVRLGAVAYDQKVVSIWAGFRTWFLDRNLEFDYVLFSNYESQVEALMSGVINVAWNSPLAWVRSRRLAEASGVALRALVMRDTDRDLTSAVVVATGSPYRNVADLAGKVVATGAIDSPQASLLPLDLIRTHGIDPTRDLMLSRFDVGVGLHGDHIGGERDAVRAVLKGAADAACILAANHLAFAIDGTAPAGSLAVIAETEPFDHCTLTANTHQIDVEAADRLADLLLSMDYADDTVRPLLDLEGLKRWVPGRVEGYELLERAVDNAGFYDRHGLITATDYRP